MSFNAKDKYNISDLISIVNILRGPDGCPWDKNQDHASIRRNFIEETYEVVEAIDNNDTELLKEELGDVLLQVVFHSQIESELGSFNFEDVVNDICMKLIRRHPHIFGSEKATNTSQALGFWEQAKQVENS